ncbi:MAG: PAS domain-containing protein [Desulfomonile tiedjei]|uniref:PAS domain-containing protein n=1 Tax=Desulfomonile tiedjei TaxID=2358 RepID=A0A9D6Z633_9BACT|nr:PAS domain-containing protein [Desulfomonile tiedjei]
MPISQSNVIEQAAQVMIPDGRQVAELLNVTAGNSEFDQLFTSDVTSSGSFDLRQAGNDYFSRLLEALPIPAMLVHPSQRILFANKASLLLENDLSFFVGIAFSSFFTSPDEGETARHSLDKVFEDRKTRSFEGSMEFSGKRLWCRAHLRSVRFRKERLVLAILQDLTAEKLETIINAKYHQLVQVFPGGIGEFVLEAPVSVDAPVEQALHAVSRAGLIGGNLEFAKIHGLESVHSLIGSRLDELLPFGGTYELLYRKWVSQGFSVWSFETRTTRTDGTIRYFDNTLVADVRDGFLEGLWAIQQDITSRKESEEELRASRNKLRKDVQERTAELVKANELLRIEIAEREWKEQELENLVNELQTALTEVKTLSGLLPICASCKKIRDDQGYWQQIESYIRDRAGVEFSHGICPDCARILYPGIGL